MRLLLDTHTIIWWVGSDFARIGPAAKAAMSDPTTENFVSAAVIWEMAIKVQTGKLIAPTGLLDDGTAELARLSWRELIITANHGIVAARLPGSHKDPFDRLIAAQAMAENLSVATADPRIAALGAKVVW